MKDNDKEIGLPTEAVSIYGRTVWTLEIRVRSSGFQLAGRSEAGLADLLKGQI